MSDHDLSGKIAAVAGGSLGIGRAAAIRLAQGGAKVVVAARRKDAVDEVVSIITSAGGEAVGISADVSTSAGAEMLINTAVERFGGLDILVNSQGIQRYGTVEETTEALWDEVMTVNVKSMFLTAHFAVPEMRKRGGGAIVNIASVQGLATQTQVAAYSTSKAAIIGLTRTIAVDYAQGGDPRQRRAAGLDRHADAARGRRSLPRRAIERRAGPGLGQDAPGGPGRYRRKKSPS